MNITIKEGWTKKHTATVALSPIIIGIVSALTAYLSTNSLDFSVKTGFIFFLLTSLCCITMAMVDIAEDLWFDLHRK